MALNKIANEYFSGMNSMANRMWVDMEEAKSHHHQSWHELNEDEKKHILNGSIIKPQALMKYEVNNDGGNRNLKYQNNYATKITVDDNCSYQDEHSGPFSFHTKSQRDLTLVNSKKVNYKTPAVSNNKDESIAKSKVTCKAIADNVHSVTISESMFPATNLPRTGLDLLDNW